MVVFMFTILIILAIEFSVALAMIIYDDKFQYKDWLSGKNLFGMLYTVIAIIVTIPITIMIYAWDALFFIGHILYNLGIKK